MAYNDSLGKIICAAIRILFSLEIPYRWKKFPYCSDKDVLIAAIRIFLSLAISSIVLIAQCLSLNANCSVLVAQCLSPQSSK